MKNNKNGTAIKAIKDFLALIKKQNIKQVDFRFTDLNGRLHHMTHHVASVDETLLKDGIFFDGSSLPSWKQIHESDMILMPDLDSVTIDPFSAHPTVTVFCDIYDAATRERYNRDPRSIAKAAEQYLKKSGIADTAYFGPEAEFFVFDDVKISTQSHKISIELDQEEAPHNSDRHKTEGNLAHRTGVKGGYTPVAPLDSLADLRAEMVDILINMGVEMEKHHHEVATSQCELGIKYNTLLKSADSMQLYKYVVQNTAYAFGKTATFMPKPIFGDNGSGMHTHQSLWNKGKPLFAGKSYAGLSETCLHYIGGILKHAKALNAFTNPTTNSYKRLVPGYEAPVLLAYSQRNRSASCRIPYATNDAGRRVEVRFPDPTANSYLAFAAMLMAGLDGIANKIKPSDPVDKNLYALPEKELKAIPTVAGSLREALEALKADHAFLLKGDVFSKDLIAAYIDMKMDEVLRYETMPHPIEFEMYYSR